jgi:(p)ppGpp synthase/HD superfamily hydrolase
MLLEEAVLPAVKTHRGQKDKGGAPYVLRKRQIASTLTTPMGIVVVQDRLERRRAGPAGPGSSC